MNITNDTEYSLKEAAGLLGWSHFTLRDRCTAGAVPHHRRHAVVGIYFTDQDIAEIVALRRRRPSPPEDTRAAVQDQARRDAEMDAALAGLTGPRRVPRTR